MRISHLFLILLILFVATATLVHQPARAQESTVLEGDDTLTRKRDALKLQERIRLLYSQGRYAEVIEEANALLALDPNNATAILNKDNAERRIAQGDTGPPLVEQPPPNVTPVPPADLSGGTPAPGTDPNDPFAETPAQPGATPAEPAPTSAEPANLMTGGGTVNMSSDEMMKALFGDNAAANRKPTFNVIAFMAYLFGLIAAVGLGAGGIVWFTAKDLPASQTATVAPSAGRVIGIEDMPTVAGTHDDPATAMQRSAPAASAHQDQPTHVGQIEDTPPPPPPAEVLHDAVTNVETAHGKLKPEDTDYRQAGETNPDSVNLNEETDERPAPAAAAAPHKSDEPIGEENANTSGLFLVGAFVTEDQPKAEPPKEDEYGSMGLDYSATDDPMFSNSQILDIYQTTPREEEDRPSKPAVSRGIEDEVTQGPAPAATPPPIRPKPKTSSAPATPAPVAKTPPLNLGPKPAPKPKEEPVDISMPPPVRPAAAAAAQPEPEDPGAISFNSLMFGADETAGPNKPATPPAAPVKAAEPQGEDLTLTSFNQQYSNVMFGGEDEKTGFMPAPPVQAPTPAAPIDEADADVTVRLDVSSLPPAKAPAAPPPGDIQDEVTVFSPIAPEAKASDVVKDKQPPGAAAAGPKVSMFDKQKDAGREAMEAEDYARAVQCLSVAASLKPGDKEVRAMLEEARKKRRGA